MTIESSPCGALLLDEPRKTGLFFGCEEQGYAPSLKLRPEGMSLALQF